MLSRLANSITLLLPLQRGHGILAQDCRRLSAGPNLMRESLKEPASFQLQPFWTLEMFYLTSFMLAGLANSFSAIGSDVLNDSKNIRAVCFPSL